MTALDIPVITSATVDDSYTPPTIFRLSRPADVAALAQLEASGAVTVRHDLLDLQLQNFARVRTPERGRVADRSDVIDDFIAGRPMSEVGAWVFYPWSGRLVHILDEPEFVEVRTSANRNKLTNQEQQALSQKTIGILGLSVGNAVALTVALERSAGTIKVADFDELDISNLNRLRASLSDIGVNKAVLAARQIAELDPFIDVRVFPKGVNDDNIEEFFDGAPGIDLLVEECDSPWIKVRAREYARKRRIPVLMEVSDRGLLDIERFDLEPDRPLLHGLLGELTQEDLKSADRDVQLAAVAVMIGVDGISDRAAASVVEMDQSLATWPQLGAEVNHGGAVVATAARSILLGHDIQSDRVNIDIPNGIGQSPQDLPGIVLGGNHGTDEAILDEIAPDIREILQQAMRAPTGGNAQQWHFVVRGRIVDIVYVPERSKTHILYEAAHTVSRISLGNVTECVVVAARARGLTVEVEYDPNGLDDLTFTRVTIGKTGPSATEEERALGAAIDVRYSERSRAQGRALTEDEWALLENATKEFPVTLKLSEDPEVKYIYGEGTAECNRLRALVKETHRETFSEFYFRSDQPERQDGVPLENVGLTLPERTALRILRRPEVAKFLHERNEGAPLLEYTREWASGASAVGTITAASDSRHHVVEAGRAFMRLWLAATASGIGLHPTTSLMLAMEMIQGPDADIFNDAEKEQVRTLDAQFRSAMGLAEGDRLAITFRLVAGVVRSAQPLPPRRNLADHVDVVTAGTQKARPTKPVREPAEWELRPARIEDADGIAQLFHDVYKGGYPYENCTEVSLIKRTLDDGEYMWLIALDEEGSIVGSMVSRPEPGGIYELCRAAVHPDFARRGSFAPMFDMAMEMTAARPDCEMVYGYARGELAVRAFARGPIPIAYTGTNAATHVVNGRREVNLIGSGFNFGPGRDMVTRVLPAATILDPNSWVAGAAASMRTRNITGEYPAQIASWDAGGRVHESDAGRVSYSFYEASQAVIVGTVEADSPEDVRRLLWQVVDTSPTPVAHINVNLLADKVDVMRTLATPEGADPTRRFGACAYLPAWHKEDNVRFDCVTMAALINQPEPDPLDLKERIARMYASFPQELRFS